VIAVVAAAAALAAPTPVGIGLTEWQVSLGRARVPAGRVTFNVTNIGEDGHDFAVRRKGRIRAHVPELRPGEHATATVRLRTGRYVLFCGLPEHEQRGMKTRLRVVRG
jgi:FtsP/CotA-like multicopper oxidase with cupredoxin domain